jgi:hypothetical protein
MLDKARATLAGTAGSCSFGSPVDHTCMAGDSPLRAGAVYGAAGIVSSPG